ncbi:hypothetical protein GL297_08015 [Komagataeibacter sp. FXV2]|nr:hypothetical protein [Komagataeibacter sp. FXV2]
MKQKLVLISASLLKALAPGERWLTVHPNGRDDKGVHVLVQVQKDGSAKVIGGAGGALNHLRLTGVRSEAQYREEAAQRAQEHRAREKERRKAGLGEVPMASENDQTISMQDLDPSAPSGAGLGFTAHYRDRAEANGLTPEGLEQEVNEAREASLPEGLPKVTADRIGHELDKVRENLTPDKTNNAQVLAALRALFVTLGGGKYQVAGKVMLGRDTTFPGLRYSYIGADGETVEDGGYLVSSYGTLLSGSTQVGDLTIGPDGRLSYQSVKMAGSYSVTALLSDIIAGTGLVSLQGTNGCQMLPGGKILQYGANTSGSGGYSTPNFPIAFPNKCQGMIVVESAATTNWAAGKPTLHGVQGYPSTVQADVYSMIFSGAGGGWGGMNGLGYFWWAWGN